MTLKESLEHIWKVRPVAAPNKSFMEQLKVYELEQLGTSSNISVLSGTLDRLILEREKFDKIKEEMISKKLEGATG